jgi:putative thioredoxin
MSTPSFSRPGAIDLSALKRPSTTGGTGAPGEAAAAQGAYAVQVDEQNFQPVLERSMSAPVLMVFYSPTQMPASVQFADDLATLADEFGGRFLVARVDVDAAPAIAQAVQVPSVPFVAAIVQGRPLPLLQDVAPIEELRQALTEVLQQLATQGITGRHEPMAASQAEDEEGEPQVDPRHVPAQEALAAGDIDKAVEEYQKLVDANPADTEAAGGLAMAQVLHRVGHLDAQAAQEVRQAGAERPDDVAAQTAVADLDLLGGHVEDAFARLIDLVRRTSGDDREQARAHLLKLFSAVGNEDPRVLTARQALASALF